MLRIKFTLMLTAMTGPVSMWPCAGWGGPPLVAQVTEAEDGQSTPAQENPAAPLEADPLDDLLSQIQVTLKSVSVPSLQSVAKALGVEINPKGESSATSLTELGDLDGDGVPEIALKWLLTDPNEGGPQAQQSVRPSWGLFLLAWDGGGWRASRLGGSAETMQFQVVRLGGSIGRAIAVVTVEGEAGVPYPAVYQVKNHAATLVWDGQADDSRYRGYEGGRIEFRDLKQPDPTEMIVTGRADPGLLVFRKGGRRGFLAKTAYQWDGQAYVPAVTQYSANPDYTLYRFISALHLHNFKIAYALIDPAKFLKVDSPSLDKFRQLVQDSWPEFLDDQVFEALETGPDEYGFALPEKHYVYHPTISKDGKFLLTGLERQVEIVTSDK